MYKVLFSFLCSAFLYTASQAQAPGRITGSVIHKNGLAGAGATVTLLKAKDSALVKAALADKTGKYEFVFVKPGKYLVAVTSAGFSRVYSQSFAVSGDPIELPVLSLTQAIQKLEGVNVVAKRPFIETMLDKTVVNVEASPSSAGATAMDVLEKSPGIIVNNDGIISLMGKQGVIIMLDGKPSNLSPADLANMLRNMPASGLDQVEIMTNPSSKYDAAGNSGIINLKTKKGKDPGLNGSITAGLSLSVNKFGNSTYGLLKTPGSFNFNYRKGKVNYFGNYNPNYFTGRSELYLDKLFIDNNQVNSTSNQVVNGTFKSFSNTLKAGFDWYADKKNIFGVVVNGYILNGSPRQSTSTIIKNAAQLKQAELLSLSETDVRFRNFNANLNWKHTFDTTGKEITVDADYVRYANVQDVLLTTELYNSTGQFMNESLVRGRLPADINIYSVKSDYTKPFRNGRLELGVKFSYVQNDNNVRYERMVNNTWKEDGSSNRFVYNENIMAAYINLNRKIKKWSLQGGLRVENTMAKGLQKTINKDFKRDSLNLFPTVFIGYTFNKSNQLNFSYGRRINRPNYQELNPFIYYIDSLSYRVGNPALKPQYSQNFELGYLYKNKYSAKINYTHTKDVISTVVAPDIIARKTFLTSKNIADVKNIGFAVTLPLIITKAWSANLFANVFNNRYAGVYNADTIDRAYTSFNINIGNTFTISKSFSMELSGFYRHRGIDGVTIFEPAYQMSVAAQKQILKGKGTLRFNLRDPFAWQKFTTVSTYKDLVVVHAGHMDARQFTTTFTYRFGKNNLQARRRNSAIQDEQNRIGQQ